MDLPISGDATSRFSAFVEGLTSVIGHATGQTASRLLYRADDAGRAQERRADGGNYGA